jgi:enoyl-CoA hydratase/carnithine racemase
MGEYFKFEKTDHVGLLTFDFPVKRNPLNERSVSEMFENLLAIRDDDDVRALIITGAGNTFSAGADLSHMKGVTDPAEREKLFGNVTPKRMRILRRVFSLLTNYDIPTIAAVNGYAVGGGWFIALCCDFRVAVEGAQFWLPEIELGAPGPRDLEYRLALDVGMARAKEIVLMCRRFRAEELLQWGLLNRVVKTDQLMPAAYEIARYMAARKRQAVLQAKANLNGFTLD